MRLKYLPFVAVVGLVVFAVLAAAESEEEAQKEFEKWKKEHNKDYSDGKGVKGSNQKGEKEKVAYQNFKRNNDRVKAHNSNKDRTYDQQTTEHDDKSDEEKEKHYKGVKYQSPSAVKENIKQEEQEQKKAEKKQEKRVKDGNDEKPKDEAHKKVAAALDPEHTANEYQKHRDDDHHAKRVKGVDADYATDCKMSPTMDLRPNMSVVKDQGACGANWAMAPIALMEHESKVNKTNKCFSDQNLVDCNPYAAKCSGGDPVSAMYWQKVAGVPFEGEYKWTGRNQTCRNLTTPYSKGRNICYFGGGNETTIVQVLNRYKKPVIAFLATLDSGFMNYKSGIFADDKCSKNVSYSDVVVTSELNFGMLVFNRDLCIL